MSQNLPAVRQSMAASQSFESLQAQASTLLASGFLPKTIKTPEQAVAIITAGRELGMGTMESLRNIHVIEGLPSLAPKALLARAYRIVPGFQHRPVVSTADKCVINFTRGSWKGEWWSQEFTMADARLMGLANKRNWQTMPKAMLFWRCLSAGLRYVAPEADSGCYPPEELGAEVDEDGNAILDADGVVVASPVTATAVIPPPSATDTAALCKSVYCKLATEQIATQDFKKWLASPKIGALANEDASMKDMAADRLERLLANWDQAVSAYRGWLASEVKREALKDKLEDAFTGAATATPEPSLGSRAENIIGALQALDDPTLTEVLSLVADVGITIKNFEKALLAAGDDVLDILDSALKS